MWAALAIALGQCLKPPNSAMKGTEDVAAPIYIKSTTLDKTHMVATVFTPWRFSCITDFSLIAGSYLSDEQNTVLF